MKDLGSSKYISKTRAHAGLGKTLVKMENIRVKHFVPFVLLLCLARICTNIVEADQISSGKKHFVLVHGAGHGAWCWYKLATLLNSTGHNVTTIDLAASGINPIQVQQVHSFSDYVEPLIEFLGSLLPKERVILVGHSMGGAVISIAMERFPEKIAVAVYATALMPGPALSYLTIFEKIQERSVLTDTQYRYDQGANNPPTSLLFGPKQLSSRLYQLSPPEDLELALSLVRFSPLFIEEIKLTEEKYGLVPSVFIVCDQDLSIEEDLQTWMIRKNPPNEVKVINGSDHMVMFSRPLELFSNLLNVAEKYS
ncbi:putative 3-oxolaurate decarboxylase [Rosa chinensis]|uniref:(S)-hydroxynitrile lyase n=1 Tax=Rosa chinensis TaxID=74649 RepID=A0A2P6SB71_ROSCH|nr:salicylic acid-binding protein 2 [Rosa chinensis]PRQ55917.1 putative 3-oxolaurate decarboxylase [Rosa chinensis]